MIVRFTYSSVISASHHIRSHLDNGKVYLLKPYVLKLVSGLRQFCGFLHQ